MIYLLWTYDYFLKKKRINTRKRKKTVLTVVLRIPLEVINQFNHYDCYIKLA